MQLPASDSWCVIFPSIPYLSQCLNFVIFFFCIHFICPCPSVHRYTQNYKTNQCTQKIQSQSNSQGL